MNTINTTVDGAASSAYESLLDIASMIREFSSQYKIIEAKLKKSEEEKALLIEEFRNYRVNGEKGDPKNG